VADARQPEGEPASERFRPDEQRRPRNRGSQSLVIAAVLVVVGGAALAVDGQWFGWVVLGGGLAALLAVTRWAVRNWD
jgi:F0F1-type ATP synthase assembly protein I